MFSDRERYFAPGQKVSKGVFWVHHYSHRESHLAVINGGHISTMQEVRR
jgi:hypothetical protein